MLPNGTRNGVKIKYCSSRKPEEDNPKSITIQNAKYGNNSRKSQVFESTRHNVDKDDVDTNDKNKKAHSNQ